MRYIYAAIIVLFSITANAYDTLVPQYNQQVLIVNHVQPTVVTQTMVYYAPYFTVTVPVPVTTPVAVAQPVQQTVYWGYPYQPIPINYYWHKRCRIFNY
jgi:hypothetical protein